MRITIEIDEHGKSTRVLDEARGEEQSPDLEAGGAAPAFEDPSVRFGSYVEDTAQAQEPGNTQGGGDGEAEFVGAGPADLDPSHDPVLDDEWESGIAPDDVSHGGVDPLASTAREGVEDAGGAPDDGGTHAQADYEPYEEMTREEPVSEAGDGSPGEQDAEDGGAALED